MYYVVQRASCYSSNPVSPCDKAVLKSIMMIDYRLGNIKDNQPLYQKWLSEGSNHRDIDERIMARDLGKEKRWVVKITSLAKLNEFIKDYGEVVISEYDFNNNYMSILIYDDYIE